MREYNPHIEGSLVYDKEYNNGNSGGSITIDWRNGNKQVVTLTGALGCIISFTPPTGACNLILRIIQGVGGSKTATWSGVPVLWPAAAAPTLSTLAGEVDIASFYFNGTSYYGMANMDFS